MVSTLARPEGTIRDLPQSAVGYGTAFPYELPQVAEAYAAGAKVRRANEHRDWWSARDPFQVAQDFRNATTLRVRHAQCELGLYQVAATAAVLIDDPRDEALWEGVANLGDSIQIHRLATHPKFRGERHGEALLASIAYGGICGDSRAERPYLRLDCAAEATDLRRYYEQRIGRVCVDEAIRESGYHAALYEAERAAMIPTSWRSG